MCVYILRARYIQRSICGCEGYMVRQQYVARLVSSEEERIACNLTHPLKDFVDCVLFRLDSCLAELLGVQTFGGQFNLQFATLSL